MNKRRALINALAALLFLGALLAGVRLVPHPPLGQELSFSQAIFDAQGELLRLTLAADQRYRLWAPLAQISPKLQEAALLQEDQYFYYHPGFNPFSLLRAAAVSYLSGGRRQGGSTITMQLARMRWRLDSRDVLGKILQTLRAIQLELCYSKDEILEAYFNYAPYGRNIEGIAAASLIYFNKSASQLTLPEILSLAVIPRAPAAYLRAFQGQPQNFRSPLLQARNQLLQRWRRNHEVDDKQAALFSLPLNLRQPEDLPFLAPHFVDQLLTERSLRRIQYIRSTLDGRLQRLLDQQIKMFVGANSRLGVNNAAALLLDWRDMSVKALVGSANYFNRAIQGQVNGAKAKRSPGSTLKPFIYALALDQGLIHSTTMLKDVPTRFGDFSPENFDYQFQGPVSAVQALVRSRNVPALQLAARLTRPDLYQFLQQAGIAGLADKSHYGLSLALGGGELSMQELARLYAMLAAEGKMRDLVFAQDMPQAPPLALLSPQAAFITLKMLEENTPPGYAAAAPSLPMYWKTGTSFGFRDAWSAGVWGPYVLIVWVGNFDNTANPALVGRRIAAPLFFAISDSVKANFPQAEFVRQPEGVSQVEVCALSGDLPNPWCPATALTWFIPGKSPLKIDDVHRPLVMNNGQAACPDREAAQVEVHEFWPSDLREAFALAGMAKQTPALPAACGILKRGQGPRIIAPSYGLTYVLRGGDNLVPLQAVSDAAVKYNYWFADKSFCGRVNAGERLYWRPARAGVYLITVVDDAGRGDKRQLTVNLEE